MYIVTDPCYIIDSENWERIVKASINDRDIVDDAKLSRLCEEYLEKVTHSKAWVSDTGCGDWCNTMSGEKVIHGRFCADSGMVCVCKTSDDQVEGAAYVNVENPEVDLSKDKNGVTQVSIKENSKLVAFSVFTYDEDDDEEY